MEGGDDLSLLLLAFLPTLALAAALRRKRESSLREWLREAPGIETASSSLRTGVTVGHFRGPGLGFGCDRLVLLKRDGMATRSKGDEITGGK